MAYIQKRPRKNGKATFTATVRLAGQPVQCETFEKYAEAKAWADKTENDMKSRRMGAGYASTKHTVDEMIDRYMQHVLITKSQKKRYIEGQRIQLKWWKKRLQGCTLANLTHHAIADAVEALAGKAHRVRRPATVNRYLAALNHVINTAIKDWGWMVENPITKVARPKEPRGRVRFLSDDERERLLNACRLCFRKPLYLIVVFAISTGARKSEILRLKKADVDLQRQVAVAYDTKNGEPRQLYLWPHLCSLLERQLYDDTFHKSEWVFPARRGKVPVNIEKEWRTAMRIAGIKDFRFHDLRHTAASYMAMNGASPADIAEALGHKSYDMVKRYAHLSTTHVAKVVTSMGERFLTPTAERKEQ